MLSSRGSPNKESPALGGYTYSSASFTDSTPWHSHSVSSSPYTVHQSRYASSVRSPNHLKHKNSFVAQPSSSSFTSARNSVVPEQRPHPLSQNVSLGAIPTPSLLAAQRTNASLMTSASSFAMPATSAASMMTSSRTTSFSNFFASKANPSRSREEHDKAIAACFPHAAEQRDTVHRLCQRMRCQMDALATVCTFLENMASIQETIAKEYTNLGKHLSASLEGKGRVAATNAQPFLAPNTSRADPLEAQMTALAGQLRVQVDHMGCDHQSGAHHLRQHIIANLKATRKLHKRKLAHFVHHIQAKLTDVYHARRNLVSHLQSHDDASLTLSLASQAPAASYQPKGALAALPQDPYLTANALTKDIQRAVDIENEASSKLAALFEEMMAWEVEFFNKCRLAMDAWKQWRTKMNQRESDMMDGMIQSEGLSAALAEQAELVEEISTKLAPAAFTFDTYLPADMYPNPVTTPVFAGPLLRPPRKKSFQSDGAWQLCYGVVTAHGYLHLFGGMQHINEDPAVVQKRVLDRIARKSIESADCDGLKFGRESLHAFPSTGDTNKPDLTSFYLHHPRSRVQRSQLNLHCMEVTYPVMEKNVLGLGKRRERGKESSVLLKAVNEADWELWLAHLSRTAARADLAPQHMDAEMDHSQSPCKTIQSIDYNDCASPSRLASYADLPDAPTLQNAW